MNRMFAIFEREMRKFFRSPVLMIMSMMLPIVQLIILGNAYGGKIRGAHVAIVDYDHGPQAVKIREACAAIAVNIATFTTVDYTDEVQAREDVRTGKIDAAIIIPAQYSRRVYAQDAPRWAWLSITPTSSPAPASSRRCNRWSTALNAPVIQPRIINNIALQFVELYPYVSYMKFLLAGTISLAMYISVMIGGGMLYIDDKARGVHEGYLVTPITKLELVMGLNLAGAIKAVLAGICLTIIGSLMAGLGAIFNPVADLELLAMIVATSIAFNGMMFLMMVRVDDPLVPRAMFGVLNTLLFFPSGACFPSSPFPNGCRPSPWSTPSPTACTGSKPSCSRTAASSPSATTCCSLCLRHRHAAHCHAAVQADALTPQGISGILDSMAGMQTGGPLLVGGWAAWLYLTSPLATCRLVTSDN
jgi:ABC-2 type transport system permease protein